MENTNDIMLGDRSLDEWVNMYPPAQDASISPEQAINMGVLKPTEPSQETQTEINQPEPVTPQGEEREYKKLSKLDTVKDIGKTMGAEALRIVAPKADSKMAEWLHYSEDDIYQHQAQTRIGETSKYLYRYGMGTLSFIFGGGKVGAAIKGIGMAKNSIATMQIGKGIQQLMGADKLIKTGANAGKLKQIGAFLGNASLSGATAGAMADFSLYSTEEGHMADAFGVTDNPLLTYLQTNENDTELNARFKNVVEGFLMGIPFGIGIDGARAVGKYFKTMRGAAQAQTADEAAKALAEATQAEQNLNKVLSTAELADTVHNMKIKADATGGDAEQMILDNLSSHQYDEAKKMLKTYNDGEQIFVHEDGTWDIAVQKWDDASKVSPEEYKKQLDAADQALADDPMNIDVRSGDTAITHQDQAVKHTWTNRGWMGENDSLITETKSGNKGNTKLANSITKSYKDKWQIDNNIKVEFVDGLTINGKAVEGNTTSTTYQGKTAKPTKATQTKIDKKKQEIRRLQDKITQLEGGNAPVNDELALLNEDLRIKYNELKDLENIPQAKKISDITIKIDTNAKNPYATLRSELEHARDLAKGEVPTKKGKHFSRYEGKNEAEVASGYVYKKAQGKAKALSPETSQNVMDEVEYKQDIEPTLNSYLNNSIEQDSISNLLGKDFVATLTDKPNIGDIIVKPQYEGQAIGYIDPDDLTSVYVAKDLTPEKTVWAIFHEHRHIEQIQKAAAGDKKYLDGLIEYGELGEQYAKNYELYQQAKASGNIQEAKRLEQIGDELYDACENHWIEQEATIEGNKYAEQWRNHNEGLQQTIGNAEKNGANSTDNVNTSGARNGQDTSSNTSIREDVQPQQLKLDFNSAEELPTKLSSGELKEPTLKDMDDIITKGAELDIEISGTDWKALARDVDNIPQNIKDLLDLEDPDTIRAFFSQEDIDSIRTRKQLFATKTINQLHDKLDALGKDAPFEAQKSILDSIDWLMEYKRKIGSSIGRELNEQNFVNEALQTFGTKRFSELNRQGIFTFVDLLNNIRDDLNLNFTRGNLLMNKKAILSKLAEVNPALVQSMMESGEDVLKKADAIITELAKGSDKAVIDKLTQDLADVFVKPEYEALLKAQQLAPTKEGWWQTMKNWTNKQGGLASFYVHNLLSSPASLIKNVVSGGMNTIYFPAKKMLVALDPFTTNSALKDKMFREGARTYANLVAGLGEAWQLAAQAFLKGEGNMSSFGADTLNMNTETFRGFHEWGSDDNFGVILQNFHSVMTRLMGASDEFLSQLNYRAIARARATEMAEAMVAAANKQGDEQAFKDSYNMIFTSFFEQGTGKPTNLDIFNEAKKMLYQTPLSGKIEDAQGRTLDIKTGKELENGAKASQSIAMKWGEALQNSSNQHLLAKFYFPFVKTGVNILQENLDHNIWYNLASPQQREILKSQTKEGALLRTQCAFGAYSFAFASILALNGAITGSMPADAKERKALLATGWRPYSWKVGDTYVSYQGYEPIHTMLGFAADFMGLLTSTRLKSDEERVMKYALEAGRVFVNNFLDKAAFRSGLQSMAALMELNESNLPNIKKSLSQPLQGALPMSSLVRGVSSLGTRDAKSPQGITERILNNYFNRGLGEYRRNAFGDKQSITNWIIAAASEQANEQPEDVELNRLAGLGYKPTEVSKTIAGYNINYNEFVDKETGRTAYDIMMDELSQSGLREAVRDLVTSEYYQNLPDGINDNATKALDFKYTSSDETKINAINDLFVEYNDKVKEEIIDKYPELYNKQGVSLLEATDTADTVKEMKLNGENLQNNVAEQFNSLL